MKEGKIYIFQFTGMIVQFSINMYKYIITFIQNECL